MESGFPKIVRLRGIEIVANSWTELDDILVRYGVDAGTKERTDISFRDNSGLRPSDRALLERFVESGSRGVLVDDVRKALAARGKVGSALRAWSHRIGLTAADGPGSFLPAKRSDGRAHRLSDAALEAARSLLDEREDPAKRSG